MGTYPALRLDGGTRSLERWFNTDGFERDSRRQLANNIRTLPPRIAHVRADAESAPNRPNFNPPNTNPSSTLFGRVNATQTGEGERRKFVGLRLIFQPRMNTARRSRNQTPRQRAEIRMILGCYVYRRLSAAARGVRLDTSGHRRLGANGAVEVDVIHDLDAVTGAESQDIGMRQMNIAGAQHVGASGKSGVDNRVVIRIGEDELTGGGCRVHDLRERGQAGREFVDTFRGRTPSGLEP